MTDDKDTSKEIPNSKPQTHLPETHVFIVLGITVAVMVLVSGPLTIAVGKAGYLFAELAMIIPAYFYLVKYKYSWKKVFRLNGIRGNLASLSLLIGLTMTVVEDEIDRLLNILVPLPLELLEAISDSLIFSNFFEFIVIGMGVVVVASFVEEALFRGFLQGTLESTRGVTKAVTTASLIFALIHFNPWWIIQILLLSMILGILTWRADSILPAVLIHAVNNALGLWSANADIEEIPVYSVNGHVSPFFLIPAILLLIWGVKRFFTLTEHLHPADDDSGDSSWEIKA